LIELIYLEGNFFDVGIDRIDFAAHEEVNLLEHAVINQLEADFDDQDFDSMSETIGLLLKNEEAKKILIEYLGDSGKEN
jgi:carbamate kinase